MDEYIGYYGNEIPIEYRDKITRLEHLAQLVHSEEIFRVGEELVNHIPIKDQLFRERIVGIVYYYYAKAAFLKDDQEAAWMYIVKSLGYIQEGGSTQLLGKVYLLLGDIAFSSEDYTSALESYLSVVDLCENTVFVEEKVWALFHYGRMMMENSHFQHAKDAYQEGLELCTDRIIHQIGLSVYLRAVGGILICCWKLNDSEQADFYFFHLQKYADEVTMERELDTEFGFLNLIWFIKHEMEENYGRKEEEIISSLDNWKPDKTSKTVILLVLKFLIQQERYSLIEQFIHWVDHNENSTFTEKVKEWIPEIKLEFYLKKGDCKQLCTAGEELLAQGEKNKQGRKNAFHKLSSMRREMKRIEQLKIELSLMNENLLSESLHDPMTGLPNRVFFADYATELIQKLRLKKTKCVVGVLDIDCFKCVNDTYGHIVGDESVIRIAKAIEDWCDGRIFCARYGGDEFVVIGENISKSEMEEKALKLKNQLILMEVKNSSSPVAPYITLSQGYFVHEVGEEENLWNFLSEADNLMYQIKRTTKNGFLVKDEWKNGKQK